MTRGNRPFNFLLITTNLFIKLWGSSSNSIWDILLTRKKCPNLQNAITLEILFRIYSKVNQVIYSSLPINSLSFKAPVPTVRYFADKVKCPKLQRAISHKVFFRIYSEVNQVIYSSLPIYSPTFKALASIVFEIFCQQDKMPKLTKGHYLWNIFQNIQKLSRSSTYHYRWTDRWTDECPRSNMPLQLLWCWRHR